MAMLPQSSPQATSVLSPQALQMLAALKAPAMPATAPAYTAPLANLNPNLAKAAQRVQMIATGQPKPTAASWG